MEKETAEAPEIALFRQNATIIHHAGMANTDGISHEESLANPEPAGSCANWIMGHLTLSYEQALPFLGQEPVLPEGALERYRRGSAPLAVDAEAVDFGELRDAFDEAASRFEAGLENLTPAALSRTQNFHGGKSETTLAKYLNFTLFHQAYHVGQLGVLRRIVGKEGAIP